MTMPGVRIYNMIVIKCLDCDFESEAHSSRGAEDYAHDHLAVWDEGKGLVNVDHRVQLIPAVKATI